MRNPNGRYRWEGGGSAKAPRSRNRYSSPAFGPSRSPSDRLILKDSQATAEPPKADTKRRRVGDGATTSSATSSGSTPKTNGHTVSRSTAPDHSPTKVKEALPFPVVSPSTPKSNATAPAKSNNANAASLLRLPQKPTAPVIPSPLRQAWSGGSPSQSDSSPSNTPPQQKQTKAANFMTELIKEVTPPKRPDLSNPYQTANPMGKVGTLPKVRAGKRVRATGKPLAPETKSETPKEQANTATAKKEKEKVYSPQAIIEATLPKVRLQFVQSIIKLILFCDR